MTKAELIKAISEKANITQKNSEEILNTVINCIKEAVKNDDKVNLKDFGIFEPRERAVRKGRNSKTGEVIQISVRINPAFKSSKQFKDFVNE